MKSKKCNLCDREYLINYFYTHLKSKKHTQNVKKSEVKILDVEPIKEKDLLITSKWNQINSHI